jgi:hypothetical protein
MMILLSVRAGDLAVSISRAVKAPNAGVSAPLKPRDFLPEAQVESFVYRSIEYAAEIPAVAPPAIRQELHPGVYAAFILCWAALFGIFALTFSGSLFTLFMIAVGALTGFMYFAVPTLANSVRPREEAGVQFADFLPGEFDTLTGPVSGAEALIHVILVPAALSVGAVAIAAIVTAARIVH